MLNYLIRRILLMFPTLLGITALVFFIMGLSPGGIGGTMLDQFGNVQSADAERIREYYNKRYHINDKLYIQYARWLNEISPLGFRDNDDGSLGRFSFKAPSFGESLEQHRKVSDLIRESLPLTLLLNLITIPIVYIIGIWTGVHAARKRGGVFDNVSGGIQQAAWSAPNMWVGVMLIGLLANRDYIKLFPISGMNEIEAERMPFLPHFISTGFQRGYLLDYLWHLALPIICLSYGGSAFLTKLTRGSMLENLLADYTRTARSKGLSDSVIIYRHVLRNSVLPLITVAAGILPSLLSGAVIVEWVFSIPGMGSLGVQAVKSRDREVVLAVTLIGGLVVLVSQIIRDVLYALADPRISYE